MKAYKPGLPLNQIVDTPPNPLDRLVLSRDQFSTLDLATLHNAVRIDHSPMPDHHVNITPLRRYIRAEFPVYNIKCDAAYHYSDHIVSFAMLAAEKELSTRPYRLVSNRALWPCLRFLLTRQQNGDTALITIEGHFHRILIKAREILHALAGCEIR